MQLLPLCKSIMVSPSETPTTLYQTKPVAVRVESKEIATRKMSSFSGCSLFVSMRWPYSQFAFLKAYTISKGQKIE
jgi:hypothetical protein